MQNLAKQAYQEQEHKLNIIKVLVCVHMPVYYTFICTFSLGVRSSVRSSVRSGARL